MYIKEEIVERKNENSEISMSDIEIFENLIVKQEKRLETEKEDVKERLKIARKKYRDREDVKERQKIAAKKYRDKKKNSKQLKVKVYILSFGQV